MALPKHLKNLGLRGVYAACLLVATCTHALPLLQHGLSWTYDGADPLTAMFWTALAFADPLAAVLLFVWPRTGLVLTTAIIALDVPINVAHFGGFVATSPWPHLWPITAVGLQITFLIFVLATVRRAWPSSEPKGSD